MQREGEKEKERGRHRYSGSKAPRPKRIGVFLRSAADSPPPAPPGAWSLWHRRPPPSCSCVWKAKLACRGQPVGFKEDERSCLKFSLQDPRAKAQERVRI